MGSSIMADLLCSEICFVNDIRLGGTADQLLAGTLLMLEAHVYITPRFVDYNSALKGTITPFLFRHGDYFTNFG